MHWYQLCINAKIFIKKNSRNVVNKKIIDLHKKKKHLILKYLFYKAQSLKNTLSYELTIFYLYTTYPFKCVLLKPIKKYKSSPTYIIHWPP